MTSDQPRRITLADIAVKAGVHVTTVSLAMRNHPRLPEATRKRIQALAAEMGYAPDPFLRALIAYRGKVMPRRNRPTLAYVTNWNTRWGWKRATAHLQFFAGAEAKANELGFQLEHFWLHEPGFTQKRFGRILYARGINGVIVASYSREMGDELQLDWPNFSAVKIDYFPHHPPLHNVTNNQCSIVRLAARKVRAAGYRRIGFVMHRGWDFSVDNNWTTGFLCEQDLLPARDRVPMHLFPPEHPIQRWMNENNPMPQVDAEPFRQWLEKYRPEVILSKGAYVLPTLERLGVQVPRDLKFVDLFLDRAGEGLTAGVRQNHEMVGATAVEILAAQLHHNKFGVPAIPTTTFVQGTWFDGASCPPLASAAPRAASRRRARP